MTHRSRARPVFSRIKALLVVVGLALTGLVVGMQIAPATTPATASSTGANFIATGHDLDWHCYHSNASECAYLKMAVDQVRNGSTLPVLSIDDGTTLTTALADAGVSNVQAVNPATASTFDATAFTSTSGTPLYSAIVVGSSTGVADISPSDSARINARAADFKTFFNGGGGILALSAAGMAGYYDFVPISVTGTSVRSPFTVTTQGAALGITSAMVNCCATHNSFATPASPLVTLETDAAGASETIGAFGVAITGGGFSPAGPTVTIDGGAIAFARSTTPMLSGTSTAVAGSAVSVTVDGQTLTTTVSATGTWMVTAATLPEGTYAVVATVTDSTTTKTGTATQSLTVDTTAPVVAITGGPAVLTDNPTRPISGTTDAAAGTTVTVTVAGQTLTTTVAAGGTWTVTPTALGDGPHTVNASIVDPAGNTGSADQIVTVDTSAPAVTIDGGAIAVTNNATPSITGTSDAAAGTTVTVTVGEQTLTTTVAIGGTWVVSPSTLSDGPYVVTARVTDPAGNVGTATQALTVDTIAPVIDVNGGATALTNNPTPTINGATDAAPGTSVTVTVGTQILTTTVSPTGTWTVTPTTLGDATYAVTATVIDEAGNVGTATQELTVDTTAPVVAIDGGATVLTNDPTTPISGTTDAAPGTTVTVTVAGQILTTTVTPEGTWTVTPATLLDGPQNVIATIVDPAGNIGTATQTLTIDTTAPAVSIDGGPTVLTSNPASPITGTSDAAAGTPVTVLVDGQTLTGWVNLAGTWSVTPVALPDGPNVVTASITDPAGNIGLATQTITVDTTLPLVTITGGPAVETNNTSAPISGSAGHVPAGTTVTVTVDGQTLTTTVDPDGSWTVTPEALPEGEYVVTASATNAAGTTGSTVQSLTVDTTAPVVAIDGGAAIITNDPTPTITGTSDAPAGSAVSVVVAGQTLTTTVSATGTWTVTSATLANGSYPVVVSVTDPAGNVGTALQNLGVDTSVPTIRINGGATVVSGKKVNVVTGSTDAVPGSTVTVTVDGHSLSAIVQPDSSWTVTLPSLADGQYVISASVTGPSDNTGTAVQTLTIDTTPPTVAVNGGKRLVVDHSPATVSGTSNAPAGTKVTVTIGDQTMITTVQPDGTWTVHPHALPAGTYVVRATIVDPAGNKTTSSQTLVLTPPAVVVSAKPTATTTASATPVKATSSAVSAVTTSTTKAGALASTGTNISGPLYLGAITILAGLSLMLITRRRRVSGAHTLK